MVDVVYLEFVYDLAYGCLYFVYRMYLVCISIISMLNVCFCWYLDEPGYCLNVLVEVRGGVCAYFEAGLTTIGLNFRGLRKEHLI